MAISSALGVAGAVPVGVVNPFAGATAPSGWLLCYGQAVSRTQYPVLFTTLSTTYGAGDGSTTFNIPDMRGRVPAGLDNMGGSDAGRLSIANTLGTTTGSETVTLTSAQSGVPAHSHPNTLTNNAVTTGAGSAHTHTQNSHTHSLTGDDNYYGNNYFVPQVIQPFDGLQYTTNGGIGSTTAVNQNESAHTHSVTSNVTISNVNNTAANAASAHDNTQPTIVLNYIIKAQ